MTTDDEDDGLAWKPRCPRCFSREMDYRAEGRRTSWRAMSAEGFPELMRCRDCGAEFARGEAELTMPMRGGYVDIPNGAEEEVT